MTADDQVKAYIKKIMGQLKEWMYGGKISKLVVVITSKETGEHVERWQFDVSCIYIHGGVPVSRDAVPNLRKERKDKVFKDNHRSRELSPRVSIAFRACCNQR